MGYVYGDLCYLNRSMQYFVMVWNTAVQLHLEKLLNSVAVNTYFFKKLQILLFWAGFSEDIWIYLSIYNWQKIILQENNLLMVNHVERVWVYWAVETDTVGKLNFGLPKYFLKDYSPFRGLLNWETACCSCCAGYA